MKLKVEDVALEILPNVAPPSVLTCHCTVAVGLAYAAAEKAAVLPEQIVCGDGCVVTTGGVSIVALIIYA